MNQSAESRAMKKLLEANGAHGQRRVSQVFADFCELTAIEIRNTVDSRERGNRVRRYAQIMSGYSPEEHDRFARILANLVNELSGELSDALGHLYMSLELGRDELGQFFTPYDVSRLIASMTCGDIVARLGDQPFVTVSEPTCGSGGMIVALAEAMRSAGLNYQRQLHVTAQDIEATSVHMTYIALSLLHIPAVVVHGNTLTMEVRDRWFTPAHVIDGWSEKLLLQTAKAVPDAVIPGADEPEETANSGSSHADEGTFV